MRILGLDIGTQGVRGIVCDEGGYLYAKSEKAFDITSTGSHGFREQEPQSWLDATVAVIAACVRENGAPIGAVALDGTSGTVLGLDANMKPTTKGIMYNDSRSGQQATKVHPVAVEHEKRHGYLFNASYALPKILWVMQNQPDVYEKSKLFVHQADYVNGFLTGIYDVTDYSNALKTGYDLLDNRWPDFIGSLGLDISKLPQVVAPCERIGCINPQVAALTGLPQQTVVYAGATDGYASSLAAGLSVPGEWATVIGTTMVLKGITKRLVLDPQGRIYSHKHPQGWWLPGGASNVGGQCLNELFGKENFDELNRTVEDFTPTGMLSYPLTMKGERFPFIRPDAEAFFACKPDDIRAQYAGVMEGVSYAERLAYDLLESLGCEVGDTILTSGGATKSAGWLRIRADILNKRLKVPASTDAATGSAMIAAAGAFGSTLSETVRSIVTFRTEVEPNTTGKAAEYDELYQRFRQECKQKGYIE